MLRKVMLLVALLLLAGAVQAQDTIVLNQLKIGMLTAQNPAASFRFTAAAGQVFAVEVVEVTTSLAPQFTITNASGALVKAVGNPTQSSRAADTASFVQAGDYLVTVTSVSGQTGQFVIRISPAEPAVPPQTLSQGTPVSGTLTNGQQITYALGGDPSRPLVLMVTGSLSATLTNSSGQIAATLGTQLEGGSFSLPASAETYQLELLNDSPLASVTYTAALTPAGGGSVIAPPISTPEVSPTAAAITLPTLPTSGECMLATMQAGVVNVRQGPDTSFDVIGTISPMSIYPVMGRTQDSSWYEIDYGGTRPSGWVAAFVTRRGGNCTNVPVSYSPPTSPPPSPQATVQIAGDNEVNTQFSFTHDINQGFSGAISYPQGDRQDTIRYRLTDIPSSVPNNTQFRYSIYCEGSGIEYAEILFSDGSSRACTPTKANYTEYVGRRYAAVGLFHHHADRRR